MQQRISLLLLALLLAISQEASLVHALRIARTPSSLARLPTKRMSSSRNNIVMDSGSDRKRVVVVGATGYIGKYVVKEAVSRGYDTVAVVRDAKKANEEFMKGAQIIESDVTDEQKLKETVFSGEKRTNIVVSCLASRSGVKSDAYLIDYQATLNTLNAATAANVDHFVLLSAFCVQKPLLQFQQAKLKFEQKLRRAGEVKKINYSIVRPTAFFKSVSGQLELLQQGWPFVMFGDGEICRCNPIAELDLAKYLLNSAEDPSMWNRVLNVGGPDKGMTMREQGEMMFEIVGKEPKFWKVPVGLFDAIIGMFEFFGQFIEGAQDAAELSRIGKYYAVEDMLTEREEEKFGSTTLKQHYERINVEGQEYDPYTTMLASKKS